MLSFLNIDHWKFNTKSIEPCFKMLNILSFFFNWPDILEGLQNEWFSDYLTQMKKSDCSFALLGSCVQSVYLKVATRGEYEPPSSFTNEWNPWVIVQMNACSTLNNRQLNNHTAFCWLSKNECGFVLYVFTENVTVNSQLSNHTTIPIEEIFMKKGL